MSEEKDFFHDDFRLRNYDDRNPIGLECGDKINWDADREERIRVYEQRVQMGELIFQVGDSRNPTPHSSSLFEFINSPAYDDFSDSYEEVGGFAGEVRKKHNRRVCRKRIALADTKQRSGVVE